LTAKKRLALNLGCGVSFLISPEWVNLDWQSNSKYVRKHNLLKRLPSDSETCDLVYSSHLIEHLTQKDARVLIKECYRALKPSGIIRLSLPDFEEMANAYVEAKRNGDNLASQFIMTEIVDQCVRLTPSGTFPTWYERATENQELEKLIKTRTGVSMRERAQSSRKNSSAKLLPSSDAIRVFFRRASNYIQRRYVDLVLFLLPRWFRSYHVSRTTPGERHMWHYDFDSLSSLLQEIGFENVEKIQNRETRSIFQDVLELDFDTTGKPIKGASTMFVEASKPK
jgi:predicted SAM-dependent methyltransferase